jgi:hypothetical protein
VRGDLANALHQLFAPLVLLGSRAHVRAKVQNLLVQPASEFLRSAPPSADSTRNKPQREVGVHVFAASPWSARARV